MKNAIYGVAYVVVAAALCVAVIAAVTVARALKLNPPLLSAGTKAG